jgi:hypothetical protein
MKTTKTIYRIAHMSSSHPDEVYDECTFAKLLTTDPNAWTDDVHHVEPISEEEAIVYRLSGEWVLL